MSIQTNSTLDHRDKSLSTHPILWANGFLPWDIKCISEGIKIVEHLLHLTLKLLCLQNTSFEIDSWAIPWANGKLKKKKSVACKIFVLADKTLVFPSKLSARI